MEYFLDLAWMAVTHWTTTTLKRKPAWQVNSSSFLSSYVHSW